jgi:hypothetical protein
MLLTTYVNSKIKKKKKNFFNKIKFQFKNHLLSRLLKVQLDWELHQTMRKIFLLMGSMMIMLLMQLVVAIIHHVCYLYELQKYKKLFKNKIKLKLQFQNYLLSL